ncbi:MFS transporter [Lentzea sp. NPDC005914]|uniref:MFS transporter n=1 Tax=Lentzea sp. NPDC005914 TaxID=3154572 RepID=UPI0033D7A113
MNRATSVRHAWPLLALVCVAQFTVVANITLVTIVLPAVQQELHVSPTDLGWVVSAYTLVFAGSLLVAGRLADLRGHRLVFVGGLAVFAAGSLGCGAAGRMWELLVARALQGLGAAAVAASALAVLIAAFPSGSARGRALGWWSAAQAGGGAAGWLLGGLGGQTVGWRWVFLANVPVAVIAAVVAARVVRSHGAKRTGRVDLLGGALATASLFLLVLGLTRIGEAGQRGSGLIVTVLGAVVLLVFVLVEKRVADPVLPFAAVRGRSVVTGIVVAGVITALTTPVLTLCALFLQGEAGLGPATSGLLFVPFNVAVVAGALIAPRARLSGAALMAVGLACIAAGALTLITVRPDAWLPVVAGFALMGAGTGLASVGSTSEGTAATSEEHGGAAGGLLNTSSEIGVAVGLAVLLTAAAEAGQRTAFVAAAVLAGATAVVVLVIRPAGRADRSR